MDNEFQNLGDYYDSLVASTKVSGPRRPAGVCRRSRRTACATTVTARSARRHASARHAGRPTWNELLYMYSSVWMSGVDGAVLYSRYFSLYDGALRKRLDNLEALMGHGVRRAPRLQSGRQRA